MMGVLQKTCNGLNFQNEDLNPTLTRMAFLHCSRRGNAGLN